MYIKELNEMKKTFKKMNLLIVTDKNGRVLYYNNFGDRYNMLEGKNPIGKSIFDLYPWLTKENSTIFKVINSGEPIVNQTQLIKINNNELLEAVNSAFPLKNENGIIGAIEISTEIGNNKPKNKGRNIITNLNAKYYFEDFITQNNMMLTEISKIKEASRNNSNVLIYGETGTGKELIAHSIHNASQRSSNPFITQNCAAIPNSLMEGLLFGTTKGSFTGAKDKQGIFEMAEGGTILLDEINSMPFETQAKLLRVVENKKVRRIGDDKNIQVDVRLIASTNQRPQDLIEEGKLRKDLFFRLNVVNVNLIPLRKRKEDIQILTEYFIEKFNRIFNKKVIRVSEEVKNIFINYEWPGNVRELKNCIESSFNSANDNIINKENLPRYIIKKTDTKNNKKGLKNLVEEYEKEIIESLLSTNNHNVAQTAKKLQIPRTTLYYKLNKYKII